MKLLGHWRRWREARAVERRVIPDELWQRTLTHFPFLGWRAPAAIAELRRLASLFLDRKEFSGAGGLVISDEMALAIAAQACLPVLHLGLEPYAGFVGIVVHPDEVVAPRERTDEHGIVHQWDEVLSGEAMDGGPLMLSWRDVRAAGESAEWGYNVVIHEFAHVLDMGNGAADGMPLLASAADRDAWIRVLDDEYAHFRTAVDRGHDTVLDPYGATGADEFFAVASESFFVTPQPMQQAHPALYELLAGYYRQDPAAERVAAGG